MNKITIDNEACIGCKTCYRACFIDVIRWDEEKRRPIFQYMEDCVNCMYCVAECPKDCLSMEVDIDYQRDWEAIPGDARLSAPRLSSLK